MRLPVSNLGDVGLYKDQPPYSLPPNAWSETDSVRFEAGGVTSLNAQRSVFTAAGITPIWIQAFPPFDDPMWVYASATAMRVYQQATGHTDITRASGAYAAGADRWHGFIFQGVGIFNKPSEHPQSWTRSLAAKTVDLANWIGASYRTWALRPYKNFLVALRIFDGSGWFPYRVRWSNAASPGAVPATWTSFANNFAGEVDIAETPDYLVDGMTLGDTFIVYKERSTWGFQLVGGGQVMRNWKIYDDIGAMGRDCVVAIPQGHVVATVDDLVIHNGQPGGAQSILSTKLRKFYNANLNTAFLENVFLCPNRPRKEVWLFYPSSDSTFANSVIMWSWETGRLGFRSITETPFAAAGPVVPAAGSDTWASGF